MAKRYKVVIPESVRRQFAAAPKDVQEMILKLVDDFKTGKKDPTKVGKPVKLDRLTEAHIKMLESGFILMANWEHKGKRFRVYGER